MILARRVSSLVVIGVLAAAASACTTYHDQLIRSQRAFDRNDHDRSLAILRDLEPDVRRLSAPEQAQYAYLRGMSDYRIGYKADARHWLAVAKVSEESSPGVLPSDWKARTTEALDELNKVVYAQGPSALLTARAEDTSDTDKTDKSAAGPTDPAVGAKQSAPKEDAPKEKETGGATKKTAPPK